MSVKGVAAGVAIYGLADPQTGEICYVGASERVLDRYHDHVRGSSQLRAWVRVLDGRPTLHILDWVAAGGDWEAAERAWIARYRAEGEPLLNILDGGGAPPFRCGEDVPTAVLTETLVAALRRHVRAGGSLTGWAREHRVSPQVASYACCGETWAHVSEPAVPRKPRQRLSDDDVAEICQRVAQGATQRAVAREFGIDPSHVSRLVRTHPRRPIGAQ